MFFFLSHAKPHAGSACAADPSSTAGTTATPAKPWPWTILTESFAIDVATLASLQTSSIETWLMAAQRIDPPQSGLNFLWICMTDQPLSWDDYHARHVYALLKRWKGLQPALQLAALGHGAAAAIKALGGVVLTEASDWKPRIGIPILLSPQNGCVELWAEPLEFRLNIQTNVQRGVLMVPLHLLTRAQIPVVLLTGNVFTLQSSFGGQLWNTMVLSLKNALE